MPTIRVRKYFIIFYNIQACVPGKAAGNAKIGIAIAKHMTAAARKPIHHAPTHTLLFGVRPILQNSLFFKLVNSLAADTEHDGANIREIGVSLVVFKRRSYQTKLPRKSRPRVNKKGAGNDSRGGEGKM